MPRVKYYYQDMVSKAFLPGHGGRLQKEPSCWKAKEEKRAEGDFVLDSQNFKVCPFPFPQCHLQTSQPPHHEL